MISLTEYFPKGKAEQFKTRGISSIEELACFTPARYLDFRTVTPIRSLSEGGEYLVKGEILDIRRGIPSRVRIKDDEGSYMSICWFGKDYILSSMAAGETYYFGGKVTEFNLSYVINNPVYFGKELPPSPVFPLYGKIPGMSEQYLTIGINKAIDVVSTSYKTSDKDSFADTLGLTGYIDALREIHAPSDVDALKGAKRRLNYEKIYDFYRKVKERDDLVLRPEIGPFIKTKKTRAFIDSLPFRLTSGQRNVLKAVMNKASKGIRVNSIISGDVGCGKTAVAEVLSVYTAENGHSVLLAAPTLVLAKQHYESFMRDLATTGLDIRLITGETTPKERKEIIKAAGKGEVDILIGTHAVFSPDIKMLDLGLCIIDEEHKFGVDQKASFEEGSKAAAHHISMTATPIPRTIAKSLYGRDTAVLQIETMPKGRLPVETVHVATMEKAFDEVYGEIRKGHQAYIVCPFIEDSASERFRDVVSLDLAVKGFDQYLKNNKTTARCVKISGDMKKNEIEEAIGHFKAHEADVLFSTTIVEVGVNVPNASVIVIMSAERFGLASLHQLRGRVGRSSIKSKCVLVSSYDSERLDLMEECSNGFEIAEKDLKLRGPGDILGTVQSGENEILKIIMDRPNLSEKVRRHVFGE